MKAQIKSEILTQFRQGRTIEALSDMYGFPVTTLKKMLVPSAPKEIFMSRISARPLMTEAEKKGLSEKKIKQIEAGRKAVITRARNKNKLTRPSQDLPAALLDLKKSLDKVMTIMSL